MQAEIVILQADHALLAMRLNSLEAAYRDFAMKECGMEKEIVIAELKNARSAPQKNKHLKAIYDAHVAVMAKAAAIKKAGGTVAAAVEADGVDKVTRTPHQVRNDVYAYQAVHVYRHQQRNSKRKNQT